MPATSFFEAQRERSKVYEMQFGGYLRQRGYYVLPTYDYSGLGDKKAPALHGKNESLVIPDLLAWRDGRAVWFEIKLKEHADFNRVRQHAVTGFSLRHYRHYQRVKAETAAPVYIIFVHLAEQCIKYGELDALPISHIYDGEKMGKHGMVFFRFSDMAELMPLNQLGKAS